jgi:hypothetical protein
MKQFTLPQVCDCGARGAVTFEPAGEMDPDPAIIAAQGSFDLDGRGGILCLSCGDRLGRNEGARSGDSRRSQTGN